MKIVKTKIYKSFGVLMQEDTYDNGAVMRYPTTSDAINPDDTDLLDEQEQAILETEANTEYLVALAEINEEA